MRPPAKRQRGVAGGEVAKALAWLDSYPQVSRWMERYDIPQLVEQSGGIVLIRDFLPPFVAEGALRILEGLPASRWNDTAAQEDYTHNNIAHRFWSVKAAADGSGGGGAEALEALLRAFTLLVPDQFNAFSAARYERGHHIAPHDDRAYTPVRLDTGAAGGGGGAWRRKLCTGRGFESRPTCLHPPAPVLSVPLHACRGGGVLLSGPHLPLLPHQRLGGKHGGSSSRPGGRFSSSSRCRASLAAWFSGSRSSPCE